MSGSGPATSQSLLGMGKKGVQHPPPHTHTPVGSGCKLVGAGLGRTAKERHLFNFLFFNSCCLPSPISAPPHLHTPPFHPPPPPPTSLTPLEPPRELSRKKTQTKTAGKKHFPKVSPRSFHPNTFFPTRGGGPPAFHQKEAKPSNE